ncbi:MAG: hypothetical protein ACXVO1_11640, partial [Tumebacillaceae bacterium]
RMENGKREFWMEQLQSYFPNCVVEDETDLNYSTCHSYLIWFPAEQSEPNRQFALQILISILAPFAVMKFLHRVSRLKVLCSNDPFRPEHVVYGKWAAQFFERNQLEVLTDELLQLTVLGVTLELQEGEPSLYNCLFEDLSSFFPYKS